MIILYIILTIFVVFGTALFLETQAEEQVKEGLLDNYSIKKNTHGNYYITGKKLWVTAQPRPLKDKFYPTQEEAERALKDYMKNQLLTLESEKFAKIVKLSEARTMLSAEIAAQQLQSILDEQDRSREQDMALLREAAALREGSIPPKARQILDKAVDAPRKRGKVPA